MTITQTVEIPANRRIILDVPHEVPTGSVILTFTPSQSSVKKKDPVTIEEALQMAEDKASDPDRKPISRFFGRHKGFFGGDGVAYQRAIRDEWE